jgi:site-specific DNA recombinase
LVRCGHCGCTLVAEVKKGRYVYYHCTGHRGKCPEPYTREELLVEQFARHLGELLVLPEVTEWLQATYVHSDLTERAARERAIAQHEAQYERLEARMETLYTDRLDGRISPTFFDAKAGEMRAQQQTLLRMIELIRSTDPAPVEAAVDLMRLTGRAAACSASKKAMTSADSLKTLVRAAAWQGGALRLEFEEPFGILRGSNRASAQKERQKPGSGRDSQIWLPGMDSNHELDKNLKSRDLLILKSR